MITRLQLLNLNVGNTLFIRNDAYYVTAKVVFSENSFTWTEFTLRDNYGGYVSITVEDQAEIVSFSRTVYIPFSDKTEINYNGKTYRLKETGVARVVRAYGDTDVDINEEVRYYDYRDETGENAIEFEAWEDETEASIASDLSLRDLHIKNSANTHSSSSYGSNNYNRRSNFNVGKVFFIIPLIFIIIGFFMVNGNKSNVRKFLTDSSQFRYKTSVTADYGKNDKADIYETSLGVKAAAETIMGNARPQEYSKLDNAENVSILYDKYYVFVYEGESGQTLVQVSSREYAYRSRRNLYGTRYGRQNSFFRDYYFYRALTRDRSRYGSTGYYSTYNPTYKSGDMGNYSGSKYYNGSSSVRRSSTTTRRSTGGGTSFGK